MHELRLKLTWTCLRPVDLFFGKMKFWYPWSVIRYFFGSWTVPKTPCTLYDPHLWSSFHIKNTISCICHSILCICHSLMCICHSIMCICHSLMCICHSVMCICHSILCICHSIVCISHLIMCWLFSWVHLSFMQLCLSILQSIMACCHSIIQYRSNIDWPVTPKQQKHRWIRQAGRTGHGAVPHKMAAAWWCVVKERFTRHLRLQRQQI